MLKEKIEASKKIQRSKPISIRYVILFVGFIERQKKVLELEKEYLAWERSVSIPRGEISTKITENDKINLELVNLKDQVQQNQNLEEEPYINKSSDVLPDGVSILSKATVPTISKLMKYFFCKYRSK